MKIFVYVTIFSFLAFLFFAGETRKELKEFSLQADIVFDTTEVLEQEFPQGYTFTFKGKEGKYFYKYYQDDSPNAELIDVHYDYFLPKDSLTFVGGTDIEEVKEKLTLLFNNFIENLSNDKEVKNLIASSSPFTSSLVVDNKEKLLNLEIKKINIDPEKALKENFEKLIITGSMEVKMNNCNRDNYLVVIYDHESKKYFLSGVSTFINSLCVKQFIEKEGYVVGTCADCTFYPADKYHALDPYYQPEVVLIDFAPGGQFINTKAYWDFKALYEKAVSDGVYIFVISGYRSYFHQYSVFESWVLSEMSQGYDRQTAEIRANMYSARPGFSEHQLGTALDISSFGCGAFLGSCFSNTIVWDWLKNNAHVFGFVMSYPEGMEESTGYGFEPWHYRWIGIDLAKEYKDQEGTLSLNKFLKQKGLF